MTRPDDEPDALLWLVLAAVVLVLLWAGALVAGWAVVRGVEELARY